METESLQTSLVNKELADGVFIPRAFKKCQQLKLDQLYPYNPEICNLNPKIREYISNHYHENVSYVDTLGSPKAREYFAQLYNVPAEDVCFVPSVQLARWYLATLFLDDEDGISCSSGLCAEYDKIRLECKYSVRGLAEFRQSKVVAVRNPDIDWQEVSESHFPRKDFQAAAESLTAQQVLVWEDHFALAPRNLETRSANFSKLQTQAPVYLLTSVTELFLNDASSFSVLVLLNNKDGKFAHLTSALANIASFYFPANSAIHSLTEELLSLVSHEEIEANFERLELRKHKLAAEFAQKGVEVHNPPPGVWLLGLPKAGTLGELLARNRVLLSPTEYYRTGPFVYVSVLHNDDRFRELFELLQHSAQ